MPVSVRPDRLQRRLRRHRYQSRQLWRLRPCLRCGTELLQWYVLGLPLRSGQALQWHGPLTLDYLFDQETGRPTYIEANPRLVEPMNATLSGVNLADLTVRVALGEMGVSDVPLSDEL